MYPEWNVQSFQSKLKQLKDHLLKYDYRKQIPLIGSISYCTYNLHVSLDGGLNSIIPMIGRHSLNFISLSSNIGIGYFIYQQNVFKNKENKNDRLILSIYSSLLFTFGSFLLSSLLKHTLLIDESKLSSTIFSLAFSIVNIYLGRKMLKLP